MYISVYITYNYLNCTADEFADCIIYDCIGSIKHNENVHTTCHTCVWPLDSPLRFAFPSSSGGLKYLEILCSLQSTRSKIKDLVKNVEHSFFKCYISIFLTLQHLYLIIQFSWNRNSYFKTWNFKRKTCELIPLCDNPPLFSRRFLPSSPPFFIHLIRNFRNTSSGSSLAVALAPANCDEWLNGGGKDRRRAQYVV